MHASNIHSPLGIPGLNDRYAAKLTSQGIRTRMELADLCAHPRRCEEFAKRIGVSPAELLRLANRAHLLGLAGMTGVYLMLLIEAGVTSLSELAATPSTELRERLSHLSRIHAPDELPSPMTLLGWIAEARLQIADMAA